MRSYNNSRYLFIKHFGSQAHLFLLDVRMWCGHLVGHEFIAMLDILLIKTFRRSKTHFFTVLLRSADILKRPEFTTTHDILIQHFCTQTHTFLQGFGMRSIHFDGTRRYRAQCSYLTLRRPNTHISPRFLYEVWLIITVVHDPGGIRSPLLSKLT